MSRSVSVRSNAVNHVARDGNLTPKGNVYAHNNYQTRLDNVYVIVLDLPDFAANRENGLQFIPGIRWQSVRNAAPIYSNNSTFTISISYRLGSGYRLCVFHLDHDDVSKPIDFLWLSLVSRDKCLTVSVNRWLINSTIFPPLFFKNISFSISTCRPLS